MEKKILQKDNVYTIQTNIRRWGNSQGIRLSKEILAQMNLQENDTVGINVYDGKMTIEKVNKPKYLNLAESQFKEECPEDLWKEAKELIISFM